MRFGMKSQNYLLEEKKLKECGLLGKKESTDDMYYQKYNKWDEIPVPRNYVSPSAGPLEFKSPVKTPKRTRAEKEGIENHVLSMYSLTLLRIEPSQLVNFPRCPDHNFFIWPNVDLYVHRYDSVLRSFKIKYSTDE